MFFSSILYLSSFPNVVVLYKLGDKDTNNNSFNLLLELFFYSLYKYARFKVLKTTFIFTFLFILIEIIPTSLLYVPYICCIFVVKYLTNKENSC